MAHFCTLLVPIMLTLILTASAANAEPKVGTVSRVQASALINNRPATPNEAIHQTDIITTDADGRIAITFLDGSVLTVGGDSEMVIDTYSYNADPTLGEALLTLSKGAFRMVTSTVVDAAPESFAIRTPLATLGIRGTDFWGGFLLPDTLDVIMLDGKGVIVTTQGGTVVIEKPGFGVTVPDKDTLPQNLKKWGAVKLGKAVQTITFKEK